MILYLDSAAAAPLLVAEPTTALCRQLWDAADDVLCTRLLHVEVSAAVARGEREGRLDERAAAAASHQLDDLWSQVKVIELDEDLMRDASQAARRFALRGYDAVHCAAAHLVRQEDLVAASGDTELLGAWEGLGLTTARTSPAAP